MAIIASIDGPNRRIYLHADTQNAEVRPVDIYKEMRTFRRTDESLRKFDLFLKAEGYVSKGEGKFTPILVTCLLGTRIVPYDSTHTLTITGEIITDEETSGTACFDRSLLTPTSIVDINYVPPQVEVIEIISGSGVTEQDKLDIADRVWDEHIDGVTHNTENTTGAALLGLSASVLDQGVVRSSTSNTLELAADASSTPGAYDPSIVTIAWGKGEGQSRLVLEYLVQSQTIVVDRNWKVLPDDTSIYVITANPGREHVNEGRVRGGTSNTITLNTLASDADGTYIGQVVFVRSGVGEDQACRIIAYDGTTKVATIDGTWAVTPIINDGYVILPTGIMLNEKIADAVWNKTLP